MSVHPVEVGRWGVPFQRRKHARVRTTLRVEYRVVGVPESRSLPPAATVRPGPRVRETIATSVSGGGLLVETGERLPVSTRLALTLHLPSATLTPVVVPVTCEARVVWTDIVSDDEPDRYHCGVEFLAIDQAARERIIAFMQSCEVAALV